MSRIGGADNLPDFSGIRPIIRPEDLSALNAALQEFESKHADFMAAADRAERAVEVTLSWVNLGEKVLALAEGVIQRRIESDAAAGQPGTPLDGIRQKLARFASMQAEIKSLLPGLLA